MPFTVCWPRAVRLLNQFYRSSPTIPQSRQRGDGLYNAPFVLASPARCVCVCVCVCVCLCVCVCVCILMCFVLCAALAPSCYVVISSDSNPTVFVCVCV